ncbi:voltage-gated potassium channel [Melghiribacillus thermohalophilus]|uniref:Voltage-gated potassium channel n=1 Tax=Melghiribacillus thermohalophilus TaxID=1324956 RepID=A0A4R3MMM0_9BACI|nr:potassium channel family protein [Melghiribacillus thermohalophilus]TCT15095.1 voltage-gated potassium channel [Melghiribacillus thermohalophilus]
MKVQSLWSWYFHLPIFVRLLLTIFCIMILFGVVIYILEPQTFSTVFEGIWWAFITGSTVGYGDYVPATTAGKLVGIGMILAGGGLLTYYMVTVSSQTVQREQKLSEGAVPYKNQDHVIIIGWNERSRHIIEMIWKFHPHEKMVLIDESLKKINYRKEHIHFIKGNPTLDHTLHHANITKAKCVIITSDQSKNEFQADQLSVLATVAVRGLNGDVPIITEILMKDQIENARRAGATSVIRTNDFMGTLFFHEIYRPKPVKPFDIILEQLASQQYREDTLPEKFQGITFLECSHKYAKKDELLVGIIRNGRFQINPPFQMKLEKDDRVIVLSSLGK